MSGEGAAAAAEGSGGGGVEHSHPYIFLFEGAELLLVNELDCIGGHNVCVSDDVCGRSGNTKMRHWYKLASRKS